MARDTAPVSRQRRLGDITAVVWKEIIIEAVVCALFVYLPICYYYFLRYMYNVLLCITIIFLCCELSRVKQGVGGQIAKY